MQWFLDAITIPVGFLGLWAWIVFARNFHASHKRKLEAARRALNTKLKED